MAFFGEDGLQRQLKQAQKDLLAKDREIGTMHLSAKAKDDALKKLRVEIERLQEEKEDLANGAGSSSDNQATESEIVARLKAENRDTQEKLNKAEMEKKRLMEEARQTSIQLNDVRLRKVSGSSGTSSTYNVSPSSSRTSRRRSNSLASDSRVHDLEAELAQLRLNAGSTVEIDSLRTQLANARRELNKAINEKMSLESKARKDVTEANNKLEDAKFELDSIRRDLEDGGSISRDDLAKRQKVWEGERAEMASRVQELERAIASGKAELDELRSAASEVERLREQLEQERPRVAPASSPSDNSLELTRLSEEVKSLQAELVQARAQITPPTASTSSSADLTIKRLERNLAKAQRDTEALEESLDRAEEENQALRTRIPLPDSPSVEVNDGKVMELEVDNERLQVEVSQLKEQVHSLRGELAALQEAHARAQELEEALHRVQADLEGKEATWDTDRQSLDGQLAGLRESVAEADKAVASKTGEVEEKAAQLVALTSTLAASESQVQQLTRQLEDLAAQSLEAEVSSLRLTVEDLNKQRNEAAQLSTDLQAQLDTLKSDLLSTREDSQMDRAELDVLRIQIADVTSKETNARAEIEAVNDQLLAAVREKTQIADELNDLRSSLADRSTESEAETRNGEILVLQAELDSTRRNAEEREQALEQEIEGLKLIKDKDAEKAEKRISDLQAQLSKARVAVQEVESRLQTRISQLEAELKVSGTRVQALGAELVTMAEAAKAAPRPSSTPDRLGLLYSKIQSLRSERDELRHSLSFAQNESRFTIRAAEADRESVKEELEAVKTDLINQQAVHDTLEQEVSSIRTQLSEKEMKLELIKNESADADDQVSADRIAQFETEVASAKAERDHLVKELGESHRQIMELNHAMAMMRTNTDSDKRLRKISMERKVLDMHKITETSNGVALDRGPVEFGSRRPGHARTKSEIATLVLPEQAQITGLSAKVADLESEVKTLAGKLERRNATIATLQLENEKLGMAQELSRESADEFDDLVAERDTIQAELDGLRAQLGTATSEIATHASRVNELETLVTGLRSDNACNLTTSEERATRIAELESDIISALAEVAAAQSIAKAHATTISTSEKDLDISTTESTEQSRSLIVGILAQRQRLSQAAVAWRHASSQAQFHATALATSKIQIKTLTEQVDAFEAERSAMSQQLQTHTQRGKALDMANEKVHELENQIETLAAECVTMAEQLDAVSAREENLAKQIEESSGTQLQLDEATRRAEEVGRELSNARHEITRLQSEIIAARGAMSATDSAKAQLEGELRQALDTAKAELSASESRASISAEVLSELSKQLKKLVGLADVEGNPMETSQDVSVVERAEASITHAANTIDSLRQRLVSIETTLKDERAKSDKLATEQKELAERLNEVKADAARQAESKDADMQKMQKSLDARTEEIRLKAQLADELQQQCDTLRAQVEDLTTQLDQATESATDHTLALQTEKAALQEKLAASSEKAEALRMEVSLTMSKNRGLALEVTTLTNEVQSTKASLVESQSTAEEVRAAMEKLEVEKEKTVGLLKYQESETMNRTSKVKSLERELQSYKAEVGQLKESLADQKIESGKLEAECAELRSALMNAQASASSHDDSELKERITELEASLTLKTQEVDEADDRTREAFKAKAKLDKKIAKLTRQLGDKELEENTKRNKVISLDPVPAPAPAAAPASAIRPASLQMPPPASSTPLTQRAPLRPVGNLEAAAQITSTPGTLKRHREGDESEKPLPAEAIMLPPSAPSSISSKSPHSQISSKSPHGQRRSFTPKRNIGTGNAGARNIFGTGAGVAARPNPFAPQE